MATLPTLLDIAADWERRARQSYDQCNSDSAEDYDFHRAREQAYRACAKELRAHCDAMAAEARAILTAPEAQIEERAE